jgi:transglutaminase-like putative cysteine protease
VRYEVTHRTSYGYDNAVSVSHHLVRLTPRELPRQHCLAHALEVQPPPTQAHERLDYFGNPTGLLIVEGPHRDFQVTARSVVEVAPTQLPDAEQTPPWELVRDLCRGDRLTAALEAVEFTFNSPLVPRHPAYAQYAAAAFRQGRPVLDAMLELTGRIHRDFKFDPEATTVATPLDEVFRQRRGVCQDFAHFQIACVRSLGLPARYVSGYLETLPPPGKPRLVGADASHAWLAFFCPEVGWIDLDPTNNVPPSERHITLAWGRDFSDVSPIRGVLTGGGSHRPAVSVDVKRVE